MTRSLTSSAYQLLDSGEHLKLERFGAVTIARPSSVCIWRRRTLDLWKQADAIYVPGRDEESGGWKFKDKPFETWNIEYVGCQLTLRLQKNGQIGLFPEHGTYLEDLIPSLNNHAGQKEKPRLLNLFAYTGLASAFFALRGWSVTHVDLSKKALTWAKTNFDLNKIPENSIRFICDDALKFLEREVKRGAKYDAVVVDPPSFSRVTKENFWKLEDVLSMVVDRCYSLVSIERGILVVTCHDPGIGAEMLANLVRDNCADPSRIFARELAIPENASARVFPTGSLAMLLPKSE